MPFYKNFKPFSLLLTGAPGWLCNTILARLGDTLPALTRVRCLVQEGIPDERIAEWRLNHPSVTEVVHGDLRDAESLHAACGNMRGGMLIHAAAVFHPRTPDEWPAVNCEGTLELARIAKHAGLKRFIFISTIAAQGASPAHAQFTEDLPCHPYSAHGKSKRDAEQALLHLHAPGAFEVVIIRPGLFYGAPVPAQQVELFKQVLRGGAPLVGGGRISRSLSYIDDLADGVILTLLHPRAAGEIFNMCDAQNYTDREILDAIAESLGVKPRYKRISTMRARAAYCVDRVLLRFGRYRKRIHMLGEAHRHSGASCQKALEMLGFAPKVKLREGIQRAVKWCREHNLLE
jgi:nucleoside-diphosphate-sugar epimerase